MRRSDPKEVQSKLLSDLNKIALKLPNGLLTRLVLDAQEFHQINMGKKNARQAGRFAALGSARRTAQRKFEEKWWEEHRHLY